MPSERTWHKGPPPHVGWWLVKDGLTATAWRWWNSRCWSPCVYEHEIARVVAAWACVETPNMPGFIQWSDYWPENARVPRIDPHKEPSNAQ